MTIMIGQKFPTDAVEAVLPNGEMVSDFQVNTYNPEGYTVVFFYPLDFTFVCPTEIVAFDKATEEFAKRGTKVIAASIDSAHCHAAWRRTQLNDGGIGEVQFPMIADMQRKISSQLGILNDAGVTYRASYLLDKDGVVRHMVVNDLPLGRSVSEMLRMVDALEFFEQHGEVCPANWKKGEAGMGADRESTAAHLSKQAA